jgi:DNA-binding NarL/FixJ family response regulator
MKNILIADDHPLTLIGTKAFVESLGYQVLEICTNGVSAFSMIKVHNPHIAILDVNMPGMTGLEIAEKIHREKIRTRVILLTMHKEYSIYKKAEEYGVAGYVTKENAHAELKPCLEAVAQGRTYFSDGISQTLIMDGKPVAQDALAGLTLMERRILELIKAEKTSKQIADVFFVSEKLIEKHRTVLIEKLGLPKEKNILLKWVLQNL